MLIFQCTGIIGAAYGEAAGYAKESSKKGLEIKQHIPVQMWTQSTMRQCVSAIRGPERGSWADSLPIILFPE